jgi:hypothetical protein
MSLRRIRTMLGAALVAVLAGVTLTAGPAVAADRSTFSTTTLPGGQVLKMTVVGQAATGEKLCVGYITSILVSGTIFCNYAQPLYYFPDGTIQLFAIGTDYAVYTVWWSAHSGVSPWVDLGGQVKRPAKIGDTSDHAYDSPWVTGYPGYTPTVGVYGNRADFVYYTRTRSTAGTWGPWVML